MRAHRFIYVVVTIAIFQSQSLASDERKWLPLSRSKLIELTAGSMYTSSLKVETLNDELDNLHARLESSSFSDRERKAFERQTRLIERRLSELAISLGTDGSVSIASNSEIPFQIVMAGNGENVHTLRVTAPVVNYLEAESERVFRILSALFSNIYPNWDNAPRWPRDSLQEAWNRSPLVTNIRPVNGNDLIVQRRINGITSATFGVRPDIVVYTVTTRVQCIPDVKLGNPFRRVIC